MVDGVKKKQKGLPKPPISLVMPSLKVSVNEKKVNASSYIAQYPVPRTAQSGFEPGFS